MDKRNNTQKNKSKHDKKPSAAQTVVPVAQVVPAVKFEAPAAAAKKSAPAPPQKK